MTKDEASDLKSHIDRLVVSKLEERMAALRTEDAERALEREIHRQQQPPIIYNQCKGNVLTMDGTPFR
jgi:dsRNA-specific ribonuclease